jgi:uncharacterized RDD family membrane protein YckC
MQWYYAVGDQRQGPVEQAEFERLVATGIIRDDTLVWRQGMAQWQPYSTVQASSAPRVDDGTEVCAVSGKRYPRREMINYEGKWISGEHRDAFFQRMREGIALPTDGAVPGPYGYGGFWRRLVAFWLDGMIQGVVLLPIYVAGAIAFAPTGRNPATELGGFMLFLGCWMIFAIGVGVGYACFFTRKYDATPGKLALGLKVLRPNGDKLSVGRIIGRHFAHFVTSLVPFAIGYIIAGFDDEKRALHDRIADTRVIKTR